MLYIVLMKQVPDTTHVKWDPKTGSLIREGVRSIINPLDKNALEAALTLREQRPGQVAIITMGPPQAREALIEALALGADQAFLVSGRSLAGSDTMATSYTLELAIRKCLEINHVGSDYLILGGRQAIDGDTAQVGPQVAEGLGIAQATVASAVEFVGEEVQVRRQTEYGYDLVAARPPLLITVAKECNTPRPQALDLLVQAMEPSRITVWDAPEIGADPERVGLNGSPTQIVRVFTPQRNRSIQMAPAGPAEAAQALANWLKEMRLI
jgi:electron transfer flavoprotein alpha/beta subunit